MLDGAKVQPRQPGVATVNSTPDEPLADLRFHWGGAYLIEHLGPDVWVAQRRDKSRGTLGAKTPAGLLVKIRDDYAAQPVPRQRSGA
jgi:hypothetical protein